MTFDDNKKDILLIESSKPSFSKDVNSREFEEKITDLAKKITIDAEIYNRLIKEIDDNKQDNINYAFSCFYLLFTVCRRQSYTKIIKLAEKYKDDFERFPIYSHLFLMAKENAATSASEMKQVLLEAHELTEKKGADFDFTKQDGVLNAYVSMACKYFESNLDERDEPFGKEILKDAYEKAKWLLSKGENAYPKFHLNIGRILILKKEYDAGEAKINEAIELLPDGVDRMSRVNEFGHYLTKCAIIRAHDSTKDELRELDKIKVSNYKIIALVTSIIGFLLGGIQIFANITNAASLIYLLIMYALLMFVLVGIVLLGLSITMKDTKKKVIIYDATILSIGVIGFIVMLILLSQGIIVIA